MKILQVTPAFPPSEFGGICSHVYHITRALMERGHKITVLTTNLRTPRRQLGYSGSRFFKGIPVIYVQSWWAGGFFLAPGALPYVLMRVADFELVHIHETRTFLSWAASRTARVGGVPYVLTSHGSLNPRIGNSLSKNFYDTITGKKTVMSASRLIATTRGEMRDIQDFGVPQWKIDVVPNAVPLEPRNRTSGAEIRTRFNIPDDHKLIVFLGRLHPIKGVDQLVEAFREVSSRTPSCTLMIVGPDFGARRALELRVEELGLDGRVVFAGPVYGSQKREIYGCADVFVLPSRYETFPMALLEAMAASVPAIIAKTCGIADDLERFRAAMVVSNTNELAEALSCCLNDPRLRGQLTQNAMMLLESEYNLEKCVSRLESIYEWVLNDGLS